MDIDQRPSYELYEFAAVLDWISRSIESSADHDLTTWLDHVAATAPTLLGIRSLGVEVRHLSGLTDLQFGVATAADVDRPTHTVRLALPATRSTLLAEVIGATPDSIVECCLRVITHSTPTGGPGRTHSASAESSPSPASGADLTPLQRIQLLESQFREMRDLIAFVSSLTAQQLDAQAATQSS